MRKAIYRESREMNKRWDHKRCASHFRHPAFSKRLCVTDQGAEEALAFANDIAQLMPVAVTDYHPVTQDSTLQNIWGPLAGTRVPTLRSDGWYVPHNGRS